MALSRRTRLRIFVPLLVVGIAVAVGLSSCSTTVPNRDPTGERFPSVEGNSLDGDVVRLPEALAGAPSLLLVGYVQDAQFDLDRYLLGLMQAKVDVAVREVPTIAGLVPGMISGIIDDGMRSGIPQEDWGAVVTVYEDADAIVEFTGNEKPRNGRALLLDGDGKVVFFHDRGYSAGVVMQIVEAVARLRGGAEGAADARRAPVGGQGR